MFLAVDKMDFTYWLQSEREKRSWSQSDLARFSGLNRAVINKLETGTEPMPKTLIAIARALHLPADLVFEKAGLLPPKSELSAKKRELLARLENADDATVQTVIEILEVAVRNQQRQVPGNLNPKTTPR